jgi:DNA modification methylase
MKKEALYQALEERGTNLSEWLREKIAEVAEPYEIPVSHYTEGLNHLNDLDNEEHVLREISGCDWAFTDADTTYLSHGLHPYSAKFIPQIPRNLIRMLSLKGETVWDPFGGSGTTALEALLLGRQAISNDVNPLSALIGEAKTTTLTNEEEQSVTELIEKAELLASSELHFSSILEKHEQEILAYAPEIPNRDKWFHSNVLEELSYLCWEIERIDSPSVRTLTRAAFSKIIVKASFQDSETRYTSKPREVERGFTLRTFATELTSSLSKIHRLAPLLRFRDATFQTADLRQEAVVPENSVDLVITSPPYPNATDYHLYHRFRLFWLGHDPRKLGKKEIGSHLRHQKEKTGIDQYLSEMSQCLSRIHDGLRAGRYAVLVLGDAVFKGETYSTAELVGEVAQQAGFDLIGLVPREVHATKRSFVSAARRLKEEFLLVLRKPSKRMRFKLFPPPYTLWKYEDNLRRRELQTVLDGNAVVPKNGDKEEAIEVRATPLDAQQFRRMTFTHGFKAANHHRAATWQAVLENGEAFTVQSSRKDPKYATHGLHAYKGKFYPQLAKSLLNLAQLKPGQTVLDPFCGSGTVLLEGYLNGLDAKGFELNPLALKISRAKTDILQVDPYLVDKLLARFIRQLDDLDACDSNREAFDEQCLSELTSWFAGPVLNKMGWITRALDEVPEPAVREFLEVCLSSIVREVSQQDPKDLRIRRRKPQIEDAPVQRLYREKLREQRTRLRQFAKRSGGAPCELGHATVWNADCRKQDAYEDAGMTEQKVDAVVTSPPYATALPYVDTDRLSILLLQGMKSKKRKAIEKSLVGARNIRKSERDDYDQRIEKEDFENITSPTAKEIISEVYALNRDADVGFRRKNKAALLYRYYADMTTAMGKLEDAVASDGSLFFVIGNNKTKAGGENGKEITIRSTQVLREIGREIGWTLAETIPITVTQEDRRHNKNSITENDILWFTK